MYDNNSCPIKSIEAVQNDLMDNMYIANVLNRIRELQSPSAVDRARWLWELLQNAQDSIKPDQFVTAKISVSENRNVTFEHTGGIFTGKAMCGLLYKYSEGKGNEESTGRFGTGFMTTLTLSEIIEVETNIYDDTDNTQVTGFYVVLYRNGIEKEELKEGLRKMRDSFKKLEPFKDFTTRFTYRNSNQSAIDLGYTSFINCGAQTMLFATKVQNFSFDYLNDKSTIERGNKDQIDDILSIHSFMVNDKNKKYERKFILISIKKQNDILTQKFKKERHLRLQIAIEFKDDELVSHENKTCLYCTFPFIGSEIHQLPFIMNCPDFEPDTERQSLLVEGLDYIPKNDRQVINSPLINKMILTESLVLFKKLLDFLINRQFKGFYLLTNGLIHFNNIKHMNQEWYFSEIITKMRKILEESPIVKTIDQKMTLLKNAYFPIYKNGSDEKQRQMYHNLVSHRYPNQTVTFEESERWENRTWEELHLINIEDLIKEEEILSQNKEKENEKLKEEEWEYLNLLLEYCNEYEHNLLTSHAIIPDMNEKRHIYSETFCESKRIHEDMLNILESIEDRWKSEHMHNNIYKIKIHEHEMKDAIDSCIKKIKSKPTLSYIVSSYLPKNNSRRRIIYEFINEILEHHVEEHQLQNEIDDELWKFSDEYLIEQFLKTIEKYDSTEVQNKFELCHRFVSFLNDQELEKKYLNERKIVPNQNFILCKLTDLRDKSNIPPEFKKIVKDCFKIDINEKELHSEITEIKCNEKSNIQCYQQSINNKFSNMKNKEDAAILLTHVLPKDKESNSYKTQSKILKLLKPIVKCNQPTILIDYGEDKLWRQSNEYVKEKIIKKKISKHDSLVDLTSFFEFNDFKATIEYLNQCYEFIKSGKIMPNQYGTLCNVEELEDGGDVDEDSLDLLKFINQKIHDYRLKLSYKGIEFPKLRRFDLNNFYKTAESELKAALKNEENRKNPEFQNILKRMNKVEDDDYMSFFSDDQKNVAHRRLLYRIYAANVKNFLRKLDGSNASECDKKRWPFELIQNARDTVINTPERKVSIDIIYVPHKHLIFRHDGDDFTFDSLIGLLFKTSEGKEYNQKAIGRFGTGFMSTHILNRKIELTGNFYQDDKKVGFHVTIDRTGKGSNEIIEHAELMTKSFKTLDNPVDYTEFKYSIENDRVDEIVQMGLESIDQNIPVTLLSCPEIKQIKVICNQTEKIYNYNPEAMNNLIIKTINDGSEEGKCFLVASVSDSNQILSQFKGEESKLSITATLEIKNQTISHWEGESLFCYFPLLGSKEKLAFPIVINSSSFEPETERNTIILNKMTKGSDKVDESCINKEILKQSINLFKIIVDQCVKLNLNDIFLLTNGLLPKNLESSNDSFDLDWYKNTFIFNMRKILEESPIVKTIDQKMTLLKNAYFPIYKNGSDEKQRQMYHNLVSHRYPNQTVTFEESERWENRTWEELHLINIEDLIKEEEILSQNKEKENEKLKEEEWEYLNLLLEYCNEYEHNLLTSHAIIPDMNEKRHIYSETFCESKRIHEDMLNILESIEDRWKSEHMHNNIYKIKIHEHEMKDAIDSCIKKIKSKPTLSYIVSSYLPKNNSRRRIIYEFINEILEHHVEEHQLQNEIDDELWKFSDEYLIEQFLKTIEKYDSTEVQNKFELCHRFVSFLNDQELEKKYLNERKIVPNQNFILCKLTDLRDKSSVPEKFKNGVLNYFQIDINNDELNHQITDIHCAKHSEISLYQDEINKKVQKIEQKVAASAFLLHFRPKKEEEDTNKKIEQIQYLYQTFFSEEEKNFILTNNLTITFDDVIQTDLSGSSLWNNANKEILKALKNTINEFSQFNDFLDFYHFDEEKAVSLLNQSYLYEINVNIPVLNGEMINYSERLMYRSDGIDKKIIDFVTTVDENDSIKSELAWFGINHSKLVQYNSSQIISKIEKATKQICQDETLRNDPKIKGLIANINEKSIDDILKFNSLNEVDQEKLLIFGKLFVSNLGPRLRELENPSDNIKKRWGWELIQNAKDTIAHDLDKKVNVKFTYDKKHLIFQHDGNDFTTKQYLAMVYKFSEDKHEQKGSTGRFGTGFLTTHIISPKVILRGNLIKNDKLTGFQVTLNRTGHKDFELEESMKDTERSKKMFDTKFDYTSFEYQYNDEEHIKRVEMGIENLKKNLPIVLLFCRNINSVAIENLDNNETVSYSLNSDEKDHIFEVKITTNNEKEEIRRFIFFSTEKESNYVSNWYRVPDRKIQVNAVLEIDANNNIISHHGTESLYCVFPLIGSKLPLPFIINSPDFETSTERDSIFLKKSSKENVSTVDNINYEILGIGLELYQNIIEFCIQKQISCLYYLAEGLNAYIAKEDHFSPKTYSKLFLTKAREILSSHAVFKTINGYKCLNDTTLIDYTFPTTYEKIEKSTREKYQKDFHSLFSQIYENPIEFEESKHWNSLLWTELSAKKHIDLLKLVSEYESITNLPFSNESQKIQFMNDLIDFVLDFDKVQITEIELIPNQNMQFCIDDSDLYFDDGVTEEAITLIHRLGCEWRKNHVFKQIVNKHYLSCHSIKDAENMIKNSIGDDNALILMEYVIPENQERIKMHNYAHSILGIPSKAIELSGFSNDIWTKCDIIVMDLLIQKIEELGYVKSPVKSVSWLNDLISFLLEKGLKQNKLQDHSIFPNQKMYFMPFTEIYEDGIKYDEIKNALQAYCQIDVRYELLHPDFNIDLGFRTKYLKYYQIEKFYLNKDDINQLGYNYYNSYIQLNTYYKDHNKYEFSIILLKYICSDEEVIQQKQKDLLQSFNTLLKGNIEEIELESSMKNATFEYISRFVAYHINQELAGKTINDIKAQTGKEVEEIITSLNNVYRFSHKEAYVPNKNLKFCIYKELMNVSNEENLLKFIEFQESLSKSIKPSRSLTNYLVMEGIKCPLINESLDLQRACANIDSLIFENYTIIMESQDSGLKIILNDLIKYIKQNNYWTYFPRLKSYKDSLISNFIISENDRDVVLAINKMPGDNRSKILNLIKEFTHLDFSGNDPDSLLKVAKLPLQFRGKIMNLIDRLSNDVTDISEEEMIGIIEEVFGIKVRRRFSSNITINNNYNTYNSYNYYTYNSINYNRYIYNHFDRCSAYFIYDNYRRPYISRGSSYYAGNALPSSSSSYVPAVYNNNNNRPSLSDNRIIGYTGEAYAYEKLLRAGFDVTWVNLSDKKESLKIVFNENTYYIKESYEHFDLIARRDNHIFYYEVKSTVNSNGDHLYMSPSQLNFMAMYKPGATKRVMYVFNVRSNPSDMVFEYIPDRLMLKYSG